MGRFDVTITGGGTPPAPSQTSFRMALQTGISNFNKARFINAVIAALSPTQVESVVVVWVCPAAACPSGVCPSTASDRISAQCREGSSFERRRTVALQLSQTFVDFLVNSGPIPLSNEAALQRIEAERQRCDAGLTCAFNEFLPTPNTPVSRVPYVSGESLVAMEDEEEEDDQSTSIPWWAILLIILAILCVLVVVIYFVCCTKKKKPKAEPAQGFPSAHYQPSAPPRDPGGEMQQWDPVRKDPRSFGSPSKDSFGALNYEDGSYTGQSSAYSTASGASGDTSLSMASASKATGVEGPIFQQHEEVNALYIDGAWYAGSIWSMNPPDEMNPYGSYNIRWYDGSHSEGVPPEQIQRR